MKDFSKIIDISQPISRHSACFPGDTPFKRNVVVSTASGAGYNLTSLTMSPHVGTHADAPAHISGPIDGVDGSAGKLPLMPFIGAAFVLDLAPHKSAIQVADVKDKIEALTEFPKRILFKTAKQIRFEVFEEEYASLSVELVHYLSAKGAILIGLDTPSVDCVHAKDLLVHQALLAGKTCWLENLDLSGAAEGNYFLSALPLKFMELEASPVRAVLLS